MNHAQVRFFKSLGVLALCAYSHMSWGTEMERATVNETIAEMVSDLELTRSSGEGHQNYEYYARAGEIARNLFRHQRTAADIAAVTLLGNLLASRVKPSEVDEASFKVGDADLGAISEVARYLLGGDSPLTGEPQRKTLLFSEMLGAMREEIMPTYVSKPVTRNVMPPIASEEITVSGMSPDAIKDPVAREAYKAAIRENRLSNFTNKRQQRLRAMEAEFAPQIVQYLRSVAATDGASARIVLKAITDARLTETEKAVVMGALKR